MTQCGMLTSRSLLRHGLIGNFLTNESFEQLLYYYVLNGGGLSTIEVPSLTAKAYNIIEYVL